MQNQSLQVADASLGCTAGSETEGNGILFPPSGDKIHHRERNMTLQATGLKDCKSNRAEKATDCEEEDVTNPVRNCNAEATPDPVLKDDDDLDNSLPLLDIPAPLSPSPSTAKDSSFHKLSGDDPHLQEDSDAPDRRDRDTIESPDKPSSRGRSCSISLADIIVSDKPSCRQNSSTRSVSGAEVRSRVKRSKKKATQRMRPKSHSPLRTAASSGQPLMDLRHILKKYQKKTDTQILYDEKHDDNICQVDFSGSLSSIPFLHPDKDEKTTRKGKRNNKRMTSSVSKRPESKSLKKVEKNLHGHVVAQDTSATTKEQDVDDEELSRVMSDGCTMEKISRRPDDVLSREITAGIEKGTDDDTVHGSESAPPHSEEKTESDLPTAPSLQSESYGCKETLRSRGKADLDFTVEDEKVHKTSGRDESEIKKENNSVDCPMDQGTSRGTHEGQDVHSPEKREAAIKDSCKETRISLTFDDGCVICGNFRPNERVQRVINDLRNDVLRNDAAVPDFELCIMNQESLEMELLDPTTKLSEADLVPVRWKEPMDPTLSPGWYLRNDA
jgi:hypothetical protein